MSAYLYTFDDDSEHPMDYETSLLPKVFPLRGERSYFEECLYLYDMPNRCV